MKYTWVLPVLLLLTSCQEQPQHVRTITNEDGSRTEVVEQRSSGGGMMEHMAGAAVAGAAAGAAGAVAHKATDHAINKFSERREQRRASKASHPMVRRGSGGMGRGRR